MLDGLHRVAERHHVPQRYCLTHRRTARQRYLIIHRVSAATSFGESCIEDDQCSKYLLESLCVQGNCSCVDGQHGYGKGCVPTAKPGEACTDTEQCVFVPELTDKVECVNNYCVCTYESTDDGYRCSVGSLIRTSTMLNVLCLIIFYLL